LAYSLHLLLLLLPLPLLLLLLPLRTVPFAPKAER
jgi:hypothetical protein